MKNDVREKKNELPMSTRKYLEKLCGNSVAQEIRNQGHCVWQEAIEEEVEGGKKERKMRNKG